MATHSGILAWKIPWTEESGYVQSRGHKELDMTDQRAHITCFQSFVLRVSFYNLVFEFSQYFLYDLSIWINGYITFYVHKGHGT